MARTPSREDLVDLSFFEASPTDDSHFSLPAVPQHAPMAASMGNRPRPQIQISSWDDVPFEFGPASSAPSTMKALPALPRSMFDKALFDVSRLKKSKSDSDGRPSFWSRIKRSKSDNRHDIRAKHISNPIPISVPRLALEVPGETPRRSLSSQLVWMPEEQMWLVTDKSSTHQQRPASRAPKATEGERTISNERLSPLFHQAIQTVAPENDACLGPYDPPPLYDNDRLWDTYSTGPIGERQWDIVARRFRRPSAGG